jgi:hypothetical protein
VKFGSPVKGKTQRDNLLCIMIDMQLFFKVYSAPGTVLSTSYFFNL